MENFWSPSFLLYFKTIISFSFEKSKKGLFKRMKMMNKIKTIKLIKTNNNFIENYDFP